MQTRKRYYKNQNFHPTRLYPVTNIPYEGTVQYVLKINRLAILYNSKQKTHIIELIRPFEENKACISPETIYPDVVHENVGEWGRLDQQQVEVSWRLFILMTSQKLRMLFEYGRSICLSFSKKMKNNYLNGYIFIGQSSKYPCE